jgi:PAS domain S-box-containing protein
VESNPSIRDPSRKEGVDKKVLLGFGIFLAVITVCGIIALYSTHLLYLNVEPPVASQLQKHYRLAMTAGLLATVLGLGVLAVGFDLLRRKWSERQRAIDQLETSEARYRRLFETAQDAILILDVASGKIIDANPFIENMLGYTHEELLGKELWQLGVPAEADSNRAVFRQVQQQGSLRHADLPLVTKAGDLLDVEFVSNVYALDAQKIIQCNIRDISQRKHLEQELRQRAEQLTEADRRKNEFLALLAHELRNPLAPIRNSVQILRQKCPLNEETHWAQDVIERQIQQMTRMVDDLLDVSRITRGKIKLQKEHFELSQAVTRALEMAQPFLDARKHHLDVSMPMEPVYLVADLPRLAQVLANLLNNAAKYTEEGGQIWLSAHRQGQELVLKVRDTGIGIPPEYLPKVFDLFSQEDQSLERTHSGLGIGLTLVRNLVKMHGGSIQAYSAGPGRGSEFVVHLPCSTDTPPPPRPAPRAPDRAARFVPRHILVVDDNIDGARSLAYLLTEEGHHVVVAHDGLAALDEARRNPPEVVLLDIGLPRLNGLEVARKLRHELGLRQALLIAMTGYGQETDRRRSREAGFDAHLVKPLELSVLTGLIDRTGLSAESWAEPCEASAKAR